MKFNPPSRVHAQNKKNDPELEEGRTAVESANWSTVQRIALKRLRKSPVDTFSHRYLGLALEGLGQRDASMQAYERAIKIYPDDVAVLINFSNVLSGQGNHQRAYELSKRATRIAPGMARTWVTMLWPCYMLAKHQEAVNAAETARKLPMSPHDHVLLLNNLSTNLRDLGRLDEALATCREAIQVAPDWPLPYINLLLFLQSKPETTAQELKEAAELYASKFEAPWVPSWPTFEDRDADPHRLLRIGFLSPDFNQHSVMYFVEGLLPQLDRRQFEVIAFYTQTHEDNVTHRVRRHVDQFHLVASLDDSSLAAFIQDLKIDILIDLAGHTAASGLRAMVRKPAPVQVTWLGYPGTTGLKSIDWRITDGIADLPGADQEYVERLWRLPDMFCVYRPMSRNPLYRYQPLYEVRPTPALTNGYITFGSCNNLSKLTDPVLRTWAKVLAAVDDAILLVEGKGFEDQQAQAEFTARCLSHGIPAARLKLIARDSSKQYLTYHDIDIALDCFPLTGGTTSTDLLWMGVPMVSMNGQDFRSRIGATVLHSLGHPEWIASDEADYVRIARELASDVEALNSRRLLQRVKIERSPVMNETLFVHQFQGAIRTMWHFWCAQMKYGANEELVLAQCDDWATHMLPSKPLQVTIASGQVIGLPAAHEELQRLTANALAVAPRDAVLAGQDTPPPITDPAWINVVTWCEYLLDAIPNEALALATLAEVEHAHGRTDFAGTYLRYAKRALELSAG